MTIKVSLAEVMEVLQIPWMMMTQAAVLAIMFLDLSRLTGQQ